MLHTMHHCTMLMCSNWVAQRSNSRVLAFYVNWIWSNLNFKINFFQHSLTYSSFIFFGWEKKKESALLLTLLLREQTQHCNYKSKSILLFHLRKTVRIRLLGSKQDVEKWLNCEPFYLPPPPPFFAVYL